MHRYPPARRLQKAIVPGCGAPCCVPLTSQGFAHQERRQKTGVEIVRKALSYPAGRQIAINAGEDVP